MTLYRCEACGGYTVGLYYLRGRLVCPRCYGGGR